MINQPSKKRCDYCASTINEREEEYHIVKYITNEYEALLFFYCDVCIAQKHDDKNNVII